MLLLTGIVLFLATAGGFLYSLPRGGKTAWFVGSEWEGYAVVGMITGMGIGVLMIIRGAASLVA